MQKECVKLADRYMPSDPADDDAVLKYTQARRLQLVKDADVDLVADPKGGTVVLKALSDLDKTALGKKKLGIAEKGAENDRLVASAVVRMFKDDGSTDPFLKENAAKGRKAYEADDAARLPEPVFVEGETEVGVSSENYAEFTSRMQRQGVSDGQDKEKK